MHRIALVANGEIDSLSALKTSLDRYSKVFAIDGGLLHCHQIEIRPDRIIGDFDSADEKLIAKYPEVAKTRLSKDKDQTDLEVAIELAFKDGATEVALFGAWGKRADHSLTNALLLGRFPGKVFLKTQGEWIFAVEKEKRLNCFEGQTISLIPIYGEVQGITTSGLKWELKEGRLDKNFIGISNICLKKEVSIALGRGILLICLHTERFATTV